MALFKTLFWGSADSAFGIEPATHQTLLSADIFQFNLRVLQLLGQGLLNALELQEPGLSVLQLKKKTTGGGFSAGREV